MSFSKYTNQLIQRILSHFKPNTYYLHTTSPLPSILIVLPNQKEKIKPLINQIVNADHFNFGEKMGKIILTQQVDNKTPEKGDVKKLNSLYDLTFNEETRFIR